MNNNELKDLKKEISAEYGSLHSPEKILNQIRIFEQGISSLKLVKPCTIDSGIKVIPQSEQNTFIEIYQSTLEEGRIVKFVPASGAATRMFKKQLSFLARFKNVNVDKVKELAGKGDDDCKATLDFFNNINHFAFIDDLRKATLLNGQIFEELFESGNIAEIIRLVTDKNGLNYSNVPKGSIPFHSYPDEFRTAFEEHIVEAIHYSAGKDKVVRLHFTISPEHEHDIKKLFKSILNKYQKDGWIFDINFSFQSPSTDTIAVTLDNKPFRDKNGKIHFRPGGHGALLKNLNELKGDIVFIKNIDNVVPDHLRDETYKHKKILCGFLIDLQKKIFNLLKKIEEKNVDEKITSEGCKLIKTEFDIDVKEILNNKSLEEKRNYLFKFLNCPIRVCGMVIREDHPGGSPFWVEAEDGEMTKQIVETAQVDISNSNQFKIFNAGTHFNPVDLACGVRDYKGNQFDLEKFSNPNTGLISNKSKDGKELKALELPGLWNGGMYHWLTIFVEVPKITFNPVKEVNDLLNPEHQPAD